MHLQMLKLPLTNKWEIQYASLSKGSIFLTRGHESKRAACENEKENTTGINAAERYFYLLWKSKSLQSNDCGKRHDILISFNMKRNDSGGKHSRKPNKMYCLTAGDNAIKKQEGTYLAPSTTAYNFIECSVKKITVSSSCIS